MRHTFEFISSLCAAVILAGCIANDIPYPQIQADIISLEAEGASGPSQIDITNRTVTIPLLETTDIRRVKITDVVLGANEANVNDLGITPDRDVKASRPLAGMSFDMRTPVYVTLTLYQDYDWEICATQNIERSFTVAGQIGSTIIDTQERTAIAYVSTKTDLNHITVKTLKLGPEGITTMKPSPEELTEFNSVRYVDIEYHGITERWYLYVIPTDISISLGSVSAWSEVAWVEASAETDSDMGFRYRKTGDKEWITVTGDAITVAGGTFSACLKHLSPQTEYEVLAYSDSDESAVETFTTGAVRQMPNSDFEEWSTSGKTIYPYAAGSAPFWGTGNPGATTLGEQWNLTTPIADVPPQTDGTLSAKLQSMYPSLAGIGKFAAGNMFVGSYAATEGTNGRVNFGREWSERPTALRGWVKYTCGVVDRASANAPIKVGDNDQGSIYIALGTWDYKQLGGTPESPVQIYTGNTDTFFTPEKPGTIAYGEIIFTQSVSNWQQFEIDIDYKRTDVVPTHIIVVCSASRYGDYFSGSTNSMMWIDDFELLYDYDD